MNQFEKLCVAMALLFGGTAVFMAVGPMLPPIWLQFAPNSAPADVPENGVIDTAGEYILNRNRHSRGGASVLAISSSDVVLDLGGHILQCSRPAPDTQTTTAIVANNVSNLTIRNGAILGCVRAIDVSASHDVTIESMNIHARYLGITATDNATGLTIRGNEFHDFAGSPHLVYSVGINRPGSDCLIERNVFRNLHRQQGSDPAAAGEGVAVIFSPDTTGCVARQNWHENTNVNHLEIGYWVGRSTVTIEENSFTNIGRAVAITVGYDAEVVDNRFWMRSPQTGSYAIGAQQGTAAGNVIIGYDEPLRGNISDGGNAILP